MSHDDGSVDVIVVVPPGTRRPEPALRALHEHHPGWRSHAVWAGDPQLRPKLTSGHSWLDTDVDEADLLRVAPDGLPWLVALAALEAIPFDGPTLVVVCGAAIAGDLGVLVPADGEIVVIPKLIDPHVTNDTHPTFENLCDDGSVSASVMGFGRDTSHVRAWIRRSLMMPSRLDTAVATGRVIELASQFFPSRFCDDPLIGASVWRWPDQPPALIDLPNYDIDRPWLADPTIGGRPHMPLGTTDRLAAVRSVSDQLAGTTEPLRLPGGIEVDETIRRIGQNNLDLPAKPWSDAARFRSWLNNEYWETIHRERPDMEEVFPYPTGHDADRFAAWARRAAIDDDAPLMIDPGSLRSTAAVERTGERSDGVNLIGYFKHQSGIANIGRRVADILSRHDVPHSTVAYERTWSPSVEPEPVTDQQLQFSASIAFVNGDQFHNLRHDVPEAFGPRHQIAGMWFWELDTVDGAPPFGHDYVDQIWGMTSFTTDPFRNLGVPVHRVWIPVAEPTRSGRKRHEFAPLATLDDRFVFGVVLDHLSITERKNPVAAIRAFRQAFPATEGHGPVLVVKTINAAVCWQNHELLMAEAAGRDDIIVWDENLPIADHVALIGSFDALVSLHRSEGAGLHLAEAMWLERPVIATNYSGNLEFMDAESSILIDADMVEVGEGLYPYPPRAMWAEPHVADAAEAMRRVVSDPGHAAEIGSTARQKMESMPSEADFVARIVQLLDLRF